jgi:hypothetical protein
VDENLLVANLVDVTHDEQNAKQDGSPDGEEEKRRVSFEFGEDQPRFVASANRFPPARKNLSP